MAITITFHLQGRGQGLDTSTFNAEEGCAYRVGHLTFLWFTGSSYLVYSVHFPITDNDYHICDVNTDCFDKILKIFQASVICIN